MKKQSEKKLGEVIREWLAERKRLRREVRQRRIRRLWVELMGESIDKYTDSLLFVRGTLYITISSAALRQELHMGRDKIKRLLNQALKDELIDEVVLK